MNAAIPEAALLDAAAPRAAERTRRQAEVVAALGAALPAHALLWHREDTVPYECDGLTAYRQQPLVVALPEAAAPHGLFYAPDPSSQIACTIGGNVAENSGGVHCLKYGLTLHNVLKVRGFAADGEPVEFGGAGLDAPGLDLLSVLIGSEGMLAVAIE